MPETLNSTTEKPQKKQSKVIKAGQPAGPWVTARKIIQYLTLAIFIGLFVVSRQGSWVGSLVNLPMRLDPLPGLSNAIASRTFLAGSAIVLLTIILTLVFGRAWGTAIIPVMPAGRFARYKQSRLSALTKNACR